MLDHITEDTLDKLFLTPEKLSEHERRTAEAHLEVCALCREHAHKLQAFYQNLQHNLESPPTERDKAFAEKFLRRTRLALPFKAIEKRTETVLDAYAEIIEPYRGALAKRFIRYIKINPMRFAGATSLAAIALVLSLLVIRPTKDTNPSYARAKDEFLIAYNKEGGELWRKHIGREYEYSSGFDDPVGQGLSTVDVDRDGRNDIVAVFNFSDPRQFPNVAQVVCYDAVAYERWRYDFHRTITFGSKSYSDDYLARRMITGDFDADGYYEVVVIVRHNPYWPSAIIRLDARSGSQLGEYWHSGHLADVAHRDINGDGIEELFFVGENNAFDRSSLLVLDPRKIEGYSPATKEYTPQGIEEGIEKYYLLLPRTDLQQEAKRPRSKATSITFNEDGSSKIRSNEYIGVQAYEIFFHFDNSLRCVRVELSDEFRTFHRRMEQEGKLTRKIDEQYYDRLLKGVLYWDGEKFVHEPTMNKRYVEAMKAKNLP